MFTLFDLLEWLEALLDHRHEHYGEWFVLFSTEERFVELNITEHEVWAGAVTNYNLSHEQWLSETDNIKLGVLGWWLEGMDSAEPKYVRRWSLKTPTAEIVGHVLRVFTSIYLAADTELVEVMRGSFADGNVGWESTL